MSTPSASTTVTCTESDADIGAAFNAARNNNDHFHAASRTVFDTPATHYRAGDIDTPIQFATVECVLGSILVVGSDRGICDICLGDNPDRLVYDFQGRFPDTQMISGERVFARYAARLAGAIEAPGTELDLPLDIRGTVFQQRVWQALRTIPVGETTSYTDIASRIGAPRSVRAVAGACGANRLAIAIPCHRVVRKNGELSGYRWGVERKRALLDREAPV